jgi:hypothetical protein
MIALFGDPKIPKDFWLAKIVRITPTDFTIQWYEKMSAGSYMPLIARDEPESEEHPYDNA